MSRVVDYGAAGIFAGATGYSALLLTASAAPTAAAAAAGFLSARLAMSQIVDRDFYRFADFAPPRFGPDEDDALLLTEVAELLLTDIVAGDSMPELLLDDRLENLPGDARVIRLFDPRSLLTAGEMSERIEEHLRNARSADFPDATAELHRALADLRTSLR